MAQKGAFALGVLSNLYAFHRSTGNSPFLYQTLDSQFPLLFSGWAWSFNKRLKNPPTDFLRPIIPDNTCAPRITAAAGTKLAGAYSSSNVRFSSLRKEVYNPQAVILHAVLLCQAFAHCRKFLTAASRKSLDRSQFQCGWPPSQASYWSSPW